ncbi:condensation domain-containing protein [Actinomadura welshii]
MSAETVAAPPAETVPLTPEQRAILLEALNEGPSAYAVQVRCEFGRFDPELFQEAWARTVSRHSALRMKVSWRGRSRPEQTVLPEPLTAVRSAHLKGADRETTRRLAMKLFDEQFEREVDLEADRLVTPFAVHSDEAAYVCWTTHHLVLDGLSSRLLLADVAEEYDALLAGEARRAPDPGSFADFVRWRLARTAASAPGPAPQRRAEPAPAPELADVISAGPAPGVSRRFVKEFPAGLTARMRAFARREGVTAAALFHAAWALADAEATGRARARLGIAGYGRPPEAPGTASMLGMFTVTHPLTVALPPEASLPDWLAGFQRDMVASWNDRGPEAGGLSGAPVVVVSHYPPLETFTGPRTGVTVELLDVVDRTPHPIVATVFIADPAMVVLNINGIEPRPGAPDRLVDRVFALLSRITGDRGPETTTVGDLIAPPAASGTRE